MNATTNEATAPPRKLKTWKATEPMREASRRNGRAAAPLARAALLAKANAFREGITGRIVELYQQGLDTPRIADRLNAEGITTRRGLPWKKMAVWRILDRAGALRRRGQDGETDGS